MGKLEKTLEKADLLILDELSYLSFNRHQSELLCKVVSDRNERGSIVLTTNLEFSKWTELFENTIMVAVLIDRLTFSLALVAQFFVDVYISQLLEFTGGVTVCVSFGHHYTQRLHDCEHAPAFGNIDTYCVHKRLLQDWIFATDDHLYPLPIQSTGCDMNA